MTTPRFFETSDAAFAHFFREARERRGLSQDRVALDMQRMGFDFHQPTVYKIEKGIRKVTVGEAVALAEIVEEPVDSLVNRTPDSPESLANEVRRAARDLVETFDSMLGSVQFAHVQQMTLQARLDDYAKSPTAFVEWQGETVPMHDVWAVLTEFQGVSAYRELWSELMADRRMQAILSALGYDPDHFNPENFV